MRKEYKNQVRILKEVAKRNKIKNKGKSIDKIIDVLLENGIKIHS